MKYFLAFKPLQGRLWGFVPAGRGKGCSKGKNRGLWVSGDVGLEWGDGMGLWGGFARSFW